MPRVVRVVVAVVVAAAVVVVGGTWVYFNVIRDDPPERLALDLSQTPPADDPLPPGGLTGTWRATDDSVLGYRVKEVAFGQNAEAVGRTSDVEGTMTIEGTTVTAVELTVDMASVTSDESRRDNQFRGRIMDTENHPTSRFVLSQPIDLGEVAAGAEPFSGTVIGRLTLRGTTKPVTIPLEARRVGTTIEVVGSLPITFADWGIPDPSFGPVTTENNGVLELRVVFQRA